MISIPSEIDFLLSRDGIRKNIRIHFENDDYHDICNDQIVYNSVKFSESLCSRNEIKFGLVEASSFQCTVVDVPNVKGSMIFVQLEIDCTSLGTEWCEQNAQTSSDLDYPFYVIPYGLFEISKCEKQTEMRQRKIEAYSYSLTNDISELTTKSVQDKFKFEGRSKLTAKFDIMMLVSSNFPDKKMEDIYSYTDVGLEYKYPQPIGPGHEVKKENDEGIWTWQWRFHGMQTVKAYSNKAQESHELVYIPQDEFLVELEEVRAFYNRMPDEIKNRMTFAEFKNMVFKTWVVTIVNGSMNDIYYGKGPYVYFQDTYTSNTNIKSRKIAEPVMFSWVEVNDKYYPPVTRGEQLIIRNRENVKMYDCKLKFDTKIITMNKVFDSSTATVDITDTVGMFEGYLELNGLFGKFCRDGKFTFLTPRQFSNLYPSSNIHPSNNIYPNGSGKYVQSANYQSGWYDDVLSKPYGRIQAKYSTSGSLDSYMNYDLVEDFDDHTDEYLTYDLSDNYYFKNDTWTESEVRKQLASIANNVKNIRYMPCNLKGLGMPQLEAGDIISVQTDEGEFRTIILSRTLTGEQLLTDTIKVK